MRPVTEPLPTFFGVSGVWSYALTRYMASQHTVTPVNPLRTVKPVHREARFGNATISSSRSGGSR